MHKKWGPNNSKARKRNRKRNRIRNRSKLNRALLNTFPILQSTNILPNIIEVLRLKRYNNNSKNEIRHCINSIVQNNLHNNKYKHRSLAFKLNRELLTFGFIRTHQIILNNSIPVDIIKQIFKFYNYGLIWIIKDKNMNQFIKCKRYNDPIIGPIFEQIKLFKCQLMLYPMGWNLGTKAKVLCFFNVVDIDDNIANIMIRYSLYFHELNYEYQGVVQYRNGSTDYYYGAQCWWTEGINYDKLKNMNYKSFNIECRITVIHIEYNKSSNIENIISIIPKITDTVCVWNIHPSVLNKWKNEPKWEFYYSDNFGNNCWRLSCAPYGLEFNPDSFSSKFICLYVHLLALPYGISLSLHITCEMIVHFNTRTWKTETAACFHLGAGGREDCHGILMLESDKLKSLSNLSFTVKITVNN